MNISNTFQKREIEVYYSDLLLIRSSLQEYNASFFSAEYVNLNELDIHRWAALKSFYDKILIPKIDKGKPAKKDSIKLQMLPGQLLALFRALNSIEVKSLDLVRIAGKLHHCLINIPHLNYKSVTAKIESDT